MLEQSHVHLIPRLIGCVLSVLLRWLICYISSVRGLAMDLLGPYGEICLVHIKLLPTLSIAVPKSMDVIFLNCRLLVLIEFYWSMPAQLVVPIA